MTGSTTESAEEGSDPYHKGADRRLRILVVEPCPALPFALCDLAGARVTRAGFATIDRELLAAVAPKLVLTPLMTQRFDVLDVARLLSRLDYRGPLRAITPPIPSPHLIRAELAATWPGLNFDLIEIEAG